MVTSLLAHQALRMAKVGVATAVLRTVVVLTTSEVAVTVKKVVAASVSTEKLVEVVKTVTVLVGEATAALHAEETMAEL